MLAGLCIALALAAPPAGGEPLAAASIDLRAPPFLAAAPLLPPAASPAGASPPPCQGEVCQPRVAVPGYEPRYSMRGKKTELFLAALDRMRLEPLATAAWWLAATGLRLDAMPRTAAGPAHVELYLRLRLDAWSTPVPLVRPGG